LKASVALAILACILNCATPLLAWWLLRRSTAWPSYILSLVSHVIAIVTGALALLAMRDGVHPLLDTSEHAGLAVMVLFVGAGLPLAVLIAVLLFCVLILLTSSDIGRTDGNTSLFSLLISELKRHGGQRQLSTPNIPQLTSFYTSAIHLGRDLKLDRSRISLT
ncbi:hypothetical protein N658DRAFT_490379, partial [Parathielavia hyrcaniae]